MAHKLGCANKCLQPMVQSSFPYLDVAQGGLQTKQRALDQASCLQQLCFYYYKLAVFTFLNIKDAYDPVDRFFIWKQLASTTTPVLLILSSWEE
ncbi:hypothetical protein CU097_001723 [Rhizopus azygosporus]|uniref:Reverse transcriptase domain-containing protein n=1 Tax=Rhizopus azygosporus TaxID=86630 RepID=A0A367IRT5_RHIAZ|nr:hypothetical protein CU097_001723 [Rhizopus azygosporus]